MSDTAPKKKGFSLLNLPPEIRNRIYSYALGDNVQHIDQRLNSRICCATSSDTDILRTFTEVDKTMSISAYMKIVSCGRRNLLAFDLKVSRKRECIC